MGNDGMSADLLIAVIDDDESARDAITGLVRALGFIAAGFQSADDFLQSDSVLRTACLITDVRMPGMTGPELHRYLIASGTPIPTVLMTAYPDETIRVRAMKAGVGCCLAKPFKPDDLLDCIRSALAHQTGGLAGGLE
jgi:FixJ family two-component response regulator